MGNLELWQPQQTTSSLAQRSEQSRTLLSRSTSPLDAAKAAKKLVGSYAHLRPGDPTTFVQSIAEVLEQYPLGAVEECVDIRTGVARKLEFLTVRGLVEHLDARMEYHKALAGWRPRPAVRALPAPPAFTEEHKATMRERWAKLLAAIFSSGRTEDPVLKMRREARERAEQQLIADRARALAGTEAGQ